MALRCFFCSAVLRVALSWVLWCGVLLFRAVLCCAGLCLVVLFSLFFFSVLGWFGTLKEGEQVKENELLRCLGVPKLMKMY